MNSSEKHRKQILVVLSRFPYPLEKGDKLRAFYQLKELSKSYDITLFSTTESKVENEHINILKKYCTTIVIEHIPFWKRTLSLFIALFSDLPFQVHYFYTRSGRKKIKELIKQNSFNHIYCQLIRTSEYIKDFHQIPKTVDYMDALSTGIERRINKRPWYDRWIFNLESKRLKNYERKIFDFFENKTIISEQDRSLISHPDHNQIKCVPNGIDSSFFETMERLENYDFVFVGNMSYPPNIDAVQYIAENILPSFPESKLLVSGATPHPSIVKLSENSKQVDITGWVDDIRSSYLNGKIFLAPMNIGTGMQNKLLEAMALKTPCITTDLANNAIGTKHDEHILVGNSPEELIKHINELLDSPERRREIALNAQQFVQSKYTWSETTKQLISLID